MVDTQQGTPRDTPDTIKEVEHTADWALEVRGKNLEQLFVNAARGMFGLLADLESVEPQIKRQVALEEPDAESLLVSWLNELLWLNEETEALFVRFEIEAEAESETGSEIESASLGVARLQATVWGGPVSDQRGHIKAVTFHDLEIVETENGFKVTVVFDV